MKMEKSESIPDLTHLRHRQTGIAVNRLAGLFLDSKVQ
jgi:hypothetical protein